MKIRHNAPEQHACGSNWLASYDFLLVFSSDLRSMWNHCQAISHQCEQTVNPEKKKNNNVKKYLVM